MTKILPGRRYHKTPRPLWGDAYTINGHCFESEQATERSIYYGTFRKHPGDVRDEVIYRGRQKDKRILFAGLQAICDQLFYDPITHQEIDESIAFLRGRKATALGFSDFEFPEELWRRVVNECGGYLPLLVEAMPEGSVVYPGEPFVRVSPTKDGFGPLVAWFESTLLQVWAPSERLTAARTFLDDYYFVIRSIEPDTVSDEECMTFARLSIHDFGDRAAMSGQESELVAKMHNYVFFGTDTFRAAYQNWKNGAPPAFGSSVKALAHRIVQGFENEGDCYRRMFDTAADGEFLSMVGDCYDYWEALKNHLIPLALEAKASGSKKVIVARPDSGDSMDMVIGTLERANEAGLMEEVPTKFGTFFGSTNLRFIIGNGEDWTSVTQIIQECVATGYLPWRCGIFGIGGSLRNNLSRDDMSTKFALCAVGKDDRPVIKFSHEKGKQTLPNVVVLRDDNALFGGYTIELPNEHPDQAEDAMVVYYDGSKDAPFGPGFTDNWATIERRVIVDYEKMPATAGLVSDAVLDKVDELSKKYRGHF